MTNCGRSAGSPTAPAIATIAIDPETGKPWPAMPRCFASWPRQAAADGGFAGFAPDACLINRYEPGARLSLHQDRNEQDFTAPIVSVSLGFPRCSCSAG